MFDIKNVLKATWTIAWKWIGIPLISTILAIFVIGRLVNLLTGPESYNVYLVGDFTDENLKDFKREFSKQWNQANNLEIGGIKINVKYQAAKEKEADIVSTKLSNAHDTLMVVGHLSSTATKSALPHYLTGDPPVPVILAIEANPELIPPDYNTTYYPVFRLPPTDEEQAKRAADFTVGQSPGAIWVVEDTVWNPVYSNYLAQEFGKEVQHEMKPSKVLLWTTNREIPFPEAVKALGINWVFFAGSWSNGLILIRQVNEIWKDAPRKPTCLLR